MEALFLRVAVLSLTGSAVLLPLLLLSGRIHHRYAAQNLLLPLAAAGPAAAFAFPVPAAPARRDGGDARVSSEPARLRRDGGHPYDGTRGGRERR